MSMRVTMTLGLAAAATTISLLAHAGPTLHQDGFQYSGDSVRYKPVETFLLGDAPHRARLTIYTPQARPALSVRMSEPPASPNPPVKPAENPAVSTQIAPASPVDTATTTAKAQSPESPPSPVKSEEPVDQPSAPVQAPTPPADRLPRNDQPVAATFAEPHPTTVAACGPQTIQFKWASTWVHPKKGRALVDSLKVCGARQFVVTGYTCDLGNKQVNDRMALGRAEEVARILRRAGFEVIEVSGKGKSDYVGSNPTHREDNRRVEVTQASSSQGDPR